jgi:hypothetical protein
MGIASRRADPRDTRPVTRFRMRLIQLTTAGALIGCLYGGVALAPAAASVVTTRVAPAAHSVAAAPMSVCGAVPIPC